MSSYQELIVQREALDRQIEAARQAEQAKAIETVKTLIKQFQLSADDCGFKQGKGAAKAKQAVPVKFRGPNGEGWSGRGRIPGWLAALESQGATREQFRIAQ
jgi:DNA-binding protein H-NS